MVTRRSFRNQVPQGLDAGASSFSLGAYIHGQEVNDSEGAKDAEIQEPGNPALFQVRAPARISPRFQPVPHLFP